MQIPICDHCEKRLRGFYLEDVALTVRRDAIQVLKLSGRDFCSFNCLGDYVEDRLAGQGVIDETGL